MSDCMLSFSFVALSRACIAKFVASMCLLCNCLHGGIMQLPVYHIVTCFIAAWEVGTCCSLSFSCLVSFVRGTHACVIEPSVFTCLHVSTYVCAHVCVSVCVCACGCVHAFTHAIIDACTHTWHACIHAWICMHACAHACMRSALAVGLPGSGHLGIPRCTAWPHRVGVCRWAVRCVAGMVRHWAEFGWMRCAMGSCWAAQ
jgi:hypothetical protein